MSMRQCTMKLMGNYIFLVWRITNTASWSSTYSESALPFQKTLDPLLLCRDKKDKNSNSHTENVQPMTGYCCSR